MGTDNESVMVRINNQVYSKYNKENHSLVLMMYVCHSIQLAVLCICLMLPKELGVFNNQNR